MLTDDQLARQLLAYSHLVTFVADLHTFHVRLRLDGGLAGHQSERAAQWRRLLQDYHALRGEFQALQQDVARRQRAPRPHGGSERRNASACCAVVTWTT